MMRRSSWPLAGVFALLAAISSAIFAPRPSPAAERAPLAGRAPATLRALYDLKPPSELRAANTALVLVDFQDEFVHGGLALPAARSAIAHAAKLVAWGRRAGMLVVSVQNLSNRPGSPLFVAGSSGSAFVPELAPGGQDLVLVKNTAGAFSRTQLDAELRARGIDTLIVAGLMTHLAVLMTANDGSLLGYHVLVAADATATRALPAAGAAPGIDAQTLQRAALATMADRVADVLATHAILALPVVH